jgi:NADH:ubiquinone oxidoreductase subunit E
MPALELVVCMGSACFARGNARTLEMIQRHLAENGLAEAIQVRGTLCQDRCRQGPNLTLQAEGEAPECFCGLEPAAFVEALSEAIEDTLGRQAP